MTNVTFSVTDEIHLLMKKHSEIKWSQIARQAVIDYLEKLREKEEPEFLKILKEGRRKEEESLLKQAGGDIDKAVELWAQKIDKNLSKQRLPKWWKNATTSL